MSPSKHNEKLVFLQVCFQFCVYVTYIFLFSCIREVNKNNLLGGQFLIFLPKNPVK